MAIARRPQTALMAAVDVDELIHRGGEPANGSGHTPELPSRPVITRRVVSPADSKVTPVILRVPKETLRAIDAEVDARVVRTPRHTWLLEAIAEKLERDGK